MFARTLPMPVVVYFFMMYGVNLDGLTLIQEKRVLCERLQFSFRDPVLPASAPCREQSIGPNVFYGNVHVA